MTRTTVTCLLALGLLIGACAAPQKTEEPVGRPPTESDKLVPKDTTEEDVESKKNDRSAITRPDTTTPSR